MNPAMHIAIYNSNNSANHAAHVARVNRCKYVIDTYHAETATVSEMRSYSSCVYTVHGSGSTPMTGTEILIVKFAIVTALMFFSVGAVKGWKDDVLGGIVGAIFIGLGYVAIWFLVAIIIWLMFMLVML